MHEIRKMIAFTQIKFSWYFRGFTLVSWECLESKRFKIFLRIDLNRLRRYRALEFRQPVTQGKHSVKRCTSVLAWCSVG